MLRGWCHCNKGSRRAFEGHTASKADTLPLPWEAFQTEGITAAEAWDLNRLGVFEEQQAAQRLQGSQPWRGQEMRWEGGQGLTDEGDETFGFHPSEMANCLIQTPYTLCLLHTDTQEAGSCWRPFQSLPSKSHSQPRLHTHHLPCCDTSQSKLLGARLRHHLLWSYVSPAGPATSFAGPRWDCQIKWVKREFQIYHEYFLM